MPVFEIINKLSAGDTIKDSITILEGYTISDIAKLIEKKELYPKDEFLNSAKQDFSKDSPFLKDKPQNASLEGYIFPDTYFVSQGQNLHDLIKTALSNFGKKLTSELTNEISKQKKSIFEIVTMASMIEKEVRSLEDKKIVSGILWKRLSAGVPLQVDATVNYVTGKKPATTAISDTKIDSPYNTYQNPGLPAGPISNPGLESILAAIYPTESQYWYYLSANGSGKTIFSKTLDEHNTARAKYLR